MLIRMVTVLALVGMAGGCGGMAERDQVPPGEETEAACLVSLTNGTAGGQQCPGPAFGAAHDAALYVYATGDAPLALSVAPGCGVCLGAEHSWADLCIYDGPEVEGDGWPRDLAGWPSNGPQCAPSSPR